LLRHPSPTLFPYTTLFRSSTEHTPRGRTSRGKSAQAGERRAGRIPAVTGGTGRARFLWCEKNGQKIFVIFARLARQRLTSLHPRDRKSTRLNSSHVKISYA